MKPSPAASPAARHPHAVRHQPVTFALIHLAPGDPRRRGSRCAGSGVRARPQVEPAALLPRSAALLQRTAHGPRGAHEPAAGGPRQPRQPRSAAALRHRVSPRPGPALRPRSPGGASGSPRSSRRVRADHPGLAAGAPEGGWLRSALEALDPRALRDLTQQLGSRPDAAAAWAPWGARPCRRRWSSCSRGTARPDGGRARSSASPDRDRQPVERGLPDAEIEQTLDFWSEWWFLHRRDYVSSRRG